MSVRVGSAPTARMSAPLQPLNTSASLVKRGQVDQKHPEWLLHAKTWADTYLMYEGEPLISKHAEQFLRRKPKEDGSLYQHRVDLFTYENNLGTGLGYYEADMFNEDPEVNIRRKDKVTGVPVPDSKLSPEQDAFYTQRFPKNCDRAGTTFLDAWKKAFQYYLLYGAVWVLTDMPAPDPNAPPQTLKDQQDQQLLDPYQVLYSPLDVINWEVDATGRLNWAVVFVHIEHQNFLGKPMATDRWTYYDKQTYAIYEQTYDRVSKSQDPCGEDEKVYLVETGYHVLAPYNEVPLTRNAVPVGWWLARRAYSPARAHINVANTRDWSLQMAALAVPVVFTEKDLSQLTLSESGFLVLDPTDKYEYAEPEGNSWAELAKRAADLKESIFRSMFLIAMARDTNATAAAASGVSKQQDMAPSQVVLSGLGAVLRSAMQESLTRIIKARATVPGCEDDINLTPDIRGLEFEDKLDVTDIDVIQTVLGLEVPSDLFEKEVFMSAVRTFLKHANTDNLEAIFDQIRKAPTKEERDQAQLELRAQTIRTGIASRMKDPVSKESSD